jgi:putative transposase
MLCKPHGAKALMAENMMLRKQLITLSRRHIRSPKLSLLDRVIFAILAQLIKPRRLLKSAIIIKPATILKFHKSLINKKYSMLFSSRNGVKSLLTVQNLYFDFQYFLDVKSYA